MHDSFICSIVKDHRVDRCNQVVIPTKFRNKILKLSHGGVTAHLGTTKTKNRILRYYFWQNVVKDVCVMQNVVYVRSCDPCQTVRKDGNQKEDPFKLVPIITTIFARLNWDTVGPLLLSENNFKKTMLMVIDVSLKYLEAVSIPNIRPETITDALTLVFSCLGFPKQLM